MSILVFGSTTVDILLRPATLPARGETVLCEGYSTAPGGKGANQALAARRAGADVAFVGAVGRDAFAALAMEDLRSAGVDLGGVATVDRPTAVASVAIDDAGSNQIVVASGANAAVRAAQLDETRLVAGGLLALQMEIPWAESLAAARRARASGMRTLLNLAPALPIVVGELAAIGTLVVNEVEAEALARASGHGDDARTLSAMLGLTVVRTLGEHGAELAHDGTLWRVAAATVDVVDTTGAGDAFVGAYAAALDAGAPPQEALRWGAAAGSLACTAVGAQRALPDREGIERVARTLEATRK